MRLLAVIALTLPLTAISAAFGQSADGPAADGLAALKRYVGSQAYGQLLVDAAVAGEVQAAPDCRDIRPLDRSEFTIFQAPFFGGGTPYPVAGMWRDRLKIMRCGVVTYQNVVFMARADGPPRTALMLPGLSTALPQAQQAALPKAAAIARARAHCGNDDGLAVIDTRPDRVIRPTTRTAPNGLALDGQWQEFWQFRACGKPVGVTVTFTADGVGGAFSEAR